LREKNTERARAREASEASRSDCASDDGAASGSANDDAANANDDLDDHDRADRIHHYACARNTSNDWLARKHINASENSKRERERERERERACASEGNKVPTIVASIVAILVSLELHAILDETSGTTSRILVLRKDQHVFDALRIVVVAHRALVAVGEDERAGHLLHSSQL
jgi:hypothetical protein